MGITLATMSGSAFLSWIENSQSAYANDLITSGEAPEQALRKAEDTYKNAFPAQTPEKQNAVFNLLDSSDSIVGYLWIGQDHSPDPNTWWVWDISIDESYRGQGYGREAMLLAEKYAKSHGASTIGLSVFGFNPQARSLYQSLGYEITSIKMHKSLDNLDSN